MAIMKIKTKYNTRILPLDTTVYTGHQMLNNVVLNLIIKLYFMCTYMCTFTFKNTIGNITTVLLKV